jgi:hypothetical protein
LITKINTRFQPDAPGWCRVLRVYLAQSLILALVIGFSTLPNTGIRLVPEYFYLIPEQIVFKEEQIVYRFKLLYSGKDLDIIPNF